MTLLECAWKNFKLLNWSLSRTLNRCISGEQYWWADGVWILQKFILKYKKNQKNMTLFLF